jgi:hypothetical protein
VGGLRMLRIYEDQVGLSNTIFQVGSIKTYQYFVTTLPGTSWNTVPTQVKTGSGYYMVFTIVASHWYDDQGNHFDVTYNGDGGMATLQPCK